MPKWISACFPKLTFKGAGKDCIYLTFDDGPMLGVTDKVLDILAKADMKATFFCVGEQIEMHPELFQRIKDEGHAVGNHSMKHEDGWQTTTKAYFESIKACQALVQSKLFRPPYGRLKPWHISRLRKQFHIIMWNCLRGDYNPKRSVETCVQQTVKHCKPGSIIVLHDSHKAAENMFPTLEALIAKAKKEGWKGESLSYLEAQE